MQKAIKSFMIALIAVISIASCKKEIDFNALNNKNCKLTSLKANLDILGSYTINYSYDGLGRIAKAFSGDQTNTYNYTANKITATDQDGEMAEIVLSNGRAISSGSAGIITANGVTYDLTREYTYNADGYLSVVKNFLNGALNSTDILAYSNGNLVKAISKFEYTDFEQTTTYEYSTEVAKNTYEIADPLSYHVDYFPGGYYGKQSKNVLKKTSSVTKDSNGGTFSDANVSYTYQFDSKGNATSLVFSQLSTLYQTTGPPTTDTYIATFDLTYNCN